MIFLSLAVFSLIIHGCILMKNIFVLKRIIEKNTDLVADLQLKTSDMQSDLSYGIETLERELKAQLFHMEAVLLRKDPSAQKVIIATKRRSRTQEQKDIASKMMKERWGKRRQEQKASAPDVGESTPKLLGSG